MIPIFKPEDFYLHLHRFASPDDIVNAANQAFKKYIENNGVKVYTRHDTAGWSAIGIIKPDLQAILLNIEPVQKCKHENVESKFNPTTGVYHECKCGAKLKPKNWVEI